MYKKNAINNIEIRRQDNEEKISFSNNYYIIITTNI